MSLFAEVKNIDPLPPRPHTVRLGTRGSLLATAPSRLVAEALRRVHPLLNVELVTIKTTGDRVTDRPLHEVGGKGVFTKEIEQALLDSAIDFAVHSFKDVPVTMPLVEQSNLTFAAVPAREDARDVLVTSRAMRIDELPAGARVGTSSPRRVAQLRSIRSDLVLEPIRGNIDTRIRKLKGGQYDAILLAMAGLKRANLFDRSTMAPVELDEILPAAGQGALALQCRKDDATTLALLAPLNDPETAACVAAERRVVELLHGDCHSPIGAYAAVTKTGPMLLAAVGARDGAPPVIRVAVSHNSLEPITLATGAVDALCAEGLEISRI